MKQDCSTCTSQHKAFNSPACSGCNDLNGYSKWVPAVNAVTPAGPGIMPSVQTNKLCPVSGKQCVTCGPQSRAFCATSEKEYRDASPMPKTPPVPYTGPEHVKEIRGLRYNTGKRRYDLLPPDALALLADLYTRGAEKYAERNWELGMPYSDALASLERHLMDWKAGIDNDDETKMLHIIHVAWNAIALATWQIRNVGEDDRKKVPMPPAYVPSSTR